MNAKAELLHAIISNPKHVRFGDACRVAIQLGFVHRGGAGSHVSFARTGEPMGLNFQNCGGFIPPHQARQLVAMIEKYGGIQ